MLTKVINKEKLTEMLDRLAHETSLIAPVLEEEGVVNFKLVQGGNEVSFYYSNSAVPPKGYFFPQTEKMFSFSLQQEGINLTPPAEDKERVLYGIRPCDLRSIQTLDPVFEGTFPDTYYSSKRKLTTIIGLACEKVSRTCFCEAFNINPAEGSGSDLFFINMGENYGVKVLTSKGENLIKKYLEFFEPDQEQVEPAAEKLSQQLSEQFSRQVDLTGVKDVLDKNFDLPYWDVIAHKCLGCGICTYMCPTCHCFDIYDVSRGEQSGSRFRCWDSCMYSDFTLMAGGHNPRPGKKERVRNRFMHKLKYHMDRYGLEGCVGCGRCVLKCPVNMDIRQVIADLKEVGRNG